MPMSNRNDQSRHLNRSNLDGYRHRGDQRLLQVLLFIGLTIGLAGCSKSTPAKRPPATTLEVYAIAAAEGPATSEAIDPISGGPLFLQTPPILTTDDIATVARSEVEVMSENGRPSESVQTALDIELTPTGADKMAAATATPNQNPLALVIDGQVVATPRLHSQIRGRFQVSGLAPRFAETIDALTKP